MIKESALRPEQAVYREVVKAGDYYLRPMQQGQTIRILDLEGNQAADTLFYNLHDTSERYSAIDTMRGQGNVYLTAGTVLFIVAQPVPAIVAWVASAFVWILSRLR